MKKLYVGIDIGVNGGIACIDEGHRLRIVKTMPILPITDKVSREIDVPAFAGFISSLNQGWDVHILMEEPIAMPKQNIKATATTFVNYGRLDAVLKLHLCIYETVRPRDWSEVICGIKPKKMTYAEDKKRKALIAKKLFYGKGWEPKTNTEILSQCDAILIAEYNYKSHVISTRPVKEDWGKASEDFFLGD